MRVTPVVITDTRFYRPYKDTKNCNIKNRSTGFCDVPLNYGKSNLVSFGNEVTDDQKFDCKCIIHSASVICGATSAALGEGAALGADTPILWGTQGLMFYGLKNVLDVDDWAHIFYMARQYATGTYIGINGAKFICDWLGIGAHAVSAATTGGTASPAITGTVRSVNASLSTLITEKMGWGYVNNYKNNRMTAKTQGIQTAIYALGLGLLGHSQDLLPDNAQDIAKAMENVPMEDKITMGKTMKFLFNHLNLRRDGIMFTLNFLNGVISSRNLDETSRKNAIKDSVLIALLNSTIYELLNISDEVSITHEAQETVNKLAEELKNNPEMNEELKKAQEEILDKINYDKLDSKEFIRQFRNNDFIYNLAVFSSETTSILTDKWKKRNIVKIKKKEDELQKKIDEFNKKKSDIDKLSPEEKKELNNLIRQVAQKSIDEMKHATNANFAMSRVAGYDNLKVLLNLALIEPIKKKEENVSNLIVFYGPSGLGKTLMGQAIAQDTGSKFASRSVGFNEEKIMDWIKKEVESAKFDSSRYKIIELNEADGFLRNNPKLKKEFLAILDNCSKKNNCIFILTTNNPMDIDKDILAKSDLNVPFNTPNPEDVKSISRHYAMRDNLNYDEISKHFRRFEPNAVYSNAQIERIMDYNETKDYTQKDIIARIEATRPAITEDIIKKFESEKIKLNGDKHVY